MAGKFFRPQPAQELYESLADAAQAASAACPVLHHLVYLHAGRICDLIAEAHADAGRDTIAGEPLRRIRAAIDLLLDDVLRSVHIERLLRREHYPPPN